MNKINTNYIFERWMKLEEIIFSNSDYIKGKVRIERISLNDSINCYLSNSNKVRPALIFNFNLNNIGNISLNGVDFRIEKIPEINNQQNFLLIEKKDSISSEAFYAFTVSLLIKLKNTNSLDNLVYFIEEVVNEYNDYFKSPEKWRLNRSEEQGLFGELLVLKDLVDKFGSVAINYWLGPSKNIHDFYLDLIDLEVKTYAKIIDKKVRIANELQLTKLPDRPLYLVAIKVSENEKIGRNIKELSESIISSINDNEKKEFKKKLELVKINDKNFFPEYKFILVEQAVYLIENEKNILTTGSIPLATSNVSYDLDLNYLNKLEKFNYE
jgi:hypothetical protein